MSGQRAHCPIVAIPDHICCDLCRIPFCGNAQGFTFFGLKLGFAGRWGHLQTLGRVLDERVDDGLQGILVTLACGDREVVCR